MAQKKRKGKGCAARQEERRGYGPRALVSYQAPQQPPEGQQNARQKDHDDGEVCPEENMIDIPSEDPQPDTQLSKRVVGLQAHSTLLHPQATPEKALTAKHNISHQTQPGQPDENIYSYALAIIESTPFIRGIQDIGRYTPNQADEIIKARASGIVTQFDEVAATNCLQRDGFSADERLRGISINSRVLIYRKYSSGNVVQDIWDLFRFAIMPATYCPDLKYICLETFKTTPEVLQLASTHPWHKTLSIMQLKMNVADSWQPADSGYWAHWVEDQARKAAKARRDGENVTKELEVIISVLINFQGYKTQDSMGRIANAVSAVTQEDDIDMN